MQPLWQTTTAERREWDSNPRSLRSTVFKTVPFVRSGIPPRSVAEATRRRPPARAGTGAAEDGAGRGGEPAGREHADDDRGTLSVSAPRPRARVTRTA